MIIKVLGHLSKYPILNSAVADLTIAVMVYFPVHFSYYYPA